MSAPANSRLLSGWVRRSQKAQRIAALNAQAPTWVPSEAQVETEVKEEPKPLVASVAPWGKPVAEVESAFLTNIKKVREEALKNKDRHVLIKLPEKVQWRYADHTGT